MNPFPTQNGFELRHHRPREEVHVEGDLISHALAVLRQPRCDLSRLGLVEKTHLKKTREARMACASGRFQLKSTRKGLTQANSTQQ